MRSIERLLGMPVVSSAEGTRLGTVAGVEISPEESRVIYLRLDPAGRFRRGVIAWSDLDRVGTDAILVRSESVLRPEIAPVDAERLIAHVGDRPVITESGQRLGRISDYEVDEQTGRIARYHVPCDGLLAHLRGETLSFGPEEIRTFGKDAILVADTVVPARETEDDPAIAHRR